MLEGDRDLALSAPSCRSYLDMAKVVVFRYLFWFVLVVVFITGATRISLFGLGYLLACFYLLLFGTAMLRKPARARLVLWDCLILYNITVIISKNMLSVRAAGPWPRNGPWAAPRDHPPPGHPLGRARVATPSPSHHPRANPALCPLSPQLLSCVFVQQMQSNFCWVIQLFSLVCTVKGYYDRELLAWGFWGLPCLSWWVWGCRFGLLPNLPASLPASQGDGQGPGLLAACGGGGHHLGQHLLLLPPAPAPRLPQLLFLARHAGPPGLCPASLKVGLGSRRVPVGAGVRVPPSPSRCPCRGVALFKASILKSMRSHRQAEKKSLAQLKRQ